MKKIISLFALLACSQLTFSMDSNPNDDVNKRKLAIQESFDSVNAKLDTCTNISKDNLTAAESRNLALDALTKSNNYLNVEASKFEDSTQKLKSQTNNYNKIIIGSSAAVLLTGLLVYNHSKSK